jgi:hypothetical protein
MGKRFLRRDSSPVSRLQDGEYRDAFPRRYQVNFAA